MQSKFCMKKLHLRMELFLILLGGLIEKIVRKTLLTVYGKKDTLKEKETSGDRMGVRTGEKKEENDMAYSKKRLIAAVMAGVLGLMCTFPGYAASRKKITSVTLTIKANIEPDTDFGMENIEIESNSNRYSVDGYEILNEGFTWTEDITPQIQITLTADDDYYFTSLSKDKITLRRCRI